MFYLKAGFHMIGDRRSQIAIRSAIVCDHMETTSAIVCDPAIVSQKIEQGSISCDRLRSIAIVCDLRSAIRDYMETSLQIVHGSIFCDRLQK